MLLGGLVAAQTESTLHNGPRASEAQTLVVHMFVPDGGCRVLLRGRGGRLPDMRRSTGGGGVDHGGTASNSVASLGPGHRPASSHLHRGGRTRPLPLRLSQPAPKHAGGRSTRTPGPTTRHRSPGTRRPPRDDHRRPRLDHEPPVLTSARPHICRPITPHRRSHSAVTANPGQSLREVSLYSAGFEERYRT